MADVKTATIPGIGIAFRNSLGPIVAKTLIVTTVLCLCLFCPSTRIGAAETVGAKSAQPPYFSPVPLVQPTPFAPGLVLGSGPAFTPDGKTVYTHTWSEGQWTPGRNPGAFINTDKSEVWPRLSPDGKYLFFNREGDDQQRIYQIEVRPVLEAARKG